MRGFHGPVDESCKWDSVMGGGGILDSGFMKRLYKS